jgi:DNA-binding transcriptional regulator/RsmH inhibitor MraZ
MVELYSGSKDVTMDNKWRFFIPSDYRKEMRAYGNDALHLMKSSFNDYNLLIATPTTKEILSNNSFSSLEERLKFYSQEVVSLDGAGRIMLNRDLKNYLCIDGDLKKINLSGLGDSFVIWDKSLRDKCDPTIFSKINIL